MMKQTNYPRLASALLTIVLCATPAFGASKDMIQLQTQIQQLQDAVARLQQSNDERMGVMKDLIQQNADSVNKMSAAMDALQRNLQTQQEAQNGKLDQVSGQVQSLNDSLDEIKARLARLEKLSQDIQNQQQSIGAPGTPQGGSPAALPATPPTAAPDQPATPPPTTKRGKPSAGTPLADATPAPDTSAPSSPPVDELYKSALGDYMAAKYSVAAGEFADVIRYYPDHALSGNSFYYLGEIDYRAGKYEEAVKDYDMVVEHFPAYTKVRL
jgi:TolA-binding protein